MAKYCDICRQSYSVEYHSCPFCEAPALVEQSRPHKPVPFDEPTPLPAQAALSKVPGLRTVTVGSVETPVEISEHRENGEPQPVGPRSSAKMLLGQAGPQCNGGPSDARKPEAKMERSDTDIDLGSPTLGSKPANEGPPSGASFVSWTALIGERKNFDDDRPADGNPPPSHGQSARELLGTKSATTPTSGRFPIWFYVAAVPLGIILAVLLKLLFQ